MKTRNNFRRAQGGVVRVSTSRKVGKESGDVSVMCSMGACVRWEKRWENWEIKRTSNNQGIKAS